jgi:L-fuconolactonase
MDIVDAQVHVFLTMQESEALAAMDALGIRSVVIDELWGFDDKMQGLPFARFPDGFARAVSPLAQAASLRHPERFSYLQRVSRHDPDLPALFSLLGSSPGCRSVRIDVRDPAENQAFRDGGYDELLKLARKYDLAASVLGRETGATVRGAVARFPDLRFVVDHCGFVRTPQQWEDVLALGKNKNVWLKWSHAHRAFGAAHYPFAEFNPQLARAIDAFSVERVMWASDFTHNQRHDRSANTWAELLYSIRDSAALSEGEKEWLLGRTARRLFRWEAAKGSISKEAGS